MDFLQELIDYGMCNMIDDRLADFLENDQEYDELERKVDELEQKYMKLDISGDDKELIHEYVNSIEDLKGYMYEQSYFLGIRDTIALLARLGLIKKGDIPK